MNKRHYEHTLPNIRGSLSNTYVTMMMNFIGYISLTGKFKTVGYIYIIQMVIHL